MPPSSTRAARSGRLPAHTALLIASGDLRPAANSACWPAQRALEDDVRSAMARLGWTVRRAHPDYRSADEPHGFISSQAMGREIFASIDPEAPLIVAEAVWQYSHHVLMGLARHRGPILLLANWSGQWPGLVGALNLRGSLAKAGVKHSILWGEHFASPWFMGKLRQWCDQGRIRHDTSHVQTLALDRLPSAARILGESIARDLRARPAILGVFDEGCMGMENAIVPDHLLHAAGAYKERLSQSALYAAMREVPDAEARQVRRWLDERGMTFITGPNEETDLTDRQILEQCRMYIAAARIGDSFGCDAIGIQYQQGLKDLCAASDLAEGLLNCSDRPPVRTTDGSRIIRDGGPYTHFNEVDECAGLDGVITERVWSALGLPPDNTLHDLRWGESYRHADGREEFVWVFEISGAAPASHFEGGYGGAVSERQPPMYFRLGGGTLKGISRPGSVVWSRVFVEGDRPGGSLQMDLGLCRAVRLPREETERRWRATTPQWPIMHGVLNGVSRDQMMARHRANHVQVVYVPEGAAGLKALAGKAAAAAALGIRVHLCGDDERGRPLSEALGGGGRSKVRKRT